MRKIIAVAFALFSVNAFAQASKFVVCMEAGIHAGSAYEARQEKKRYQINPRDQDMVVGVIYAQSVAKSVKATSKKQAIEIGHNTCVESRLWSDVNKGN